MQKFDKPLAALFGLLIAALVFMAFTDINALEWAFERHQNMLSWYIRPLFIIPFCYFAYKRSWAGTLGTIFLLFTSMFWFPVPDVVTPEAREFLAMEKQWIRGTWTINETVMSLTVPLFFIMLAAAFWQRSLKIGLVIVAAAAVGKILWSIGFGSEAGKSVVVPAVLGLVICLGAIYYGFKKMESRQPKA